MAKENNEQMPDFDSLDDRIIQETPRGPFIGVKTNLDPKDPEQYNPYKQESESRD